MAPPIASAASLRARLDELAESLEALRFDLPAAPQDQRRSRRDAGVAAIRHHLIPRLGDPDAPLTLVVFGPTGSGKSTLTNSIANRIISRAGSLRPTTREAVAWVHADHADALEVSPLTETGPVEIVADDHDLLRHLTVIDTPDVDSVVAEHRLQTERILAMADAVVYVTTPQRYADAVPWELLETLSRRRLEFLVVVNRLSRRSGGAVTDLVSLLRNRDLAGIRSTDDVVTIQEQRIKSDGRLPPSAVKGVMGFLEDLRSDRRRTIDQAVTGSIDVALHTAREVVGDCREQLEEASALRSAMRAAYETQRVEVAEQLGSGDLVRSEVVARWQRMVGVSDLAEIVARGAGRLRDLVFPRSVVEEDEARRVGAEVRAELVDLILHRAGRAAAMSVNAWELDEGGRSLLGGDLRRVGETTPVVAESEVDEWFGEIVSLVTERGRNRFRVARAASIGVNAAASLLLLGVFVSTGGLTGAEVGVVAGTAAAQQSLLEHLFGTATARRLAGAARAELVERAGRVLLHDATRFEDAIDSVIDRDDRVGDLMRSIEGVEHAAREYRRA